VQQQPNITSLLMSANMSVDAIYKLHATHTFQQHLQSTGNIPGVHREYSAQHMSHLEGPE